MTGFEPSCYIWEEGHFASTAHCYSSICELVLLECGTKDEIKKILKVMDKSGIMDIYEKFYVFKHSRIGECQSKQHVSVITCYSSFY
jgi:hypothetical protein